MPRVRDNWGNLSPKTLVLLPGLDGTGNLFTNFISALPPTLSTRIVPYPTDRFSATPNSYPAW